MTPSSQMRRAAELPAMVYGAAITASSVQCPTVRYEATKRQCAVPPKLASSVQCRKVREAA